MKNFVLVIASALSSAALWIKVGPWVDDPFYWSKVELWAWPLGLIILVLSLTSLSFLLVSRYYWRLIIFAVFLAPYLLLFGTHRLILLGALTSFGLFSWAMANIQKEKVNRFSFDLHGMLKGGVHRMLTAIFILISFAYFLTPGVQSAAQRKELPPGMTRAVQVLVSDYVSQELGADDPQLANQASREVLRQVNTFLEPYFRYVPPFLAFGLFLVLQGLSLILLWLTMLISSIIFLIFKWFKIVTMQKVMREAEVVVF